MQVDPSMPGGTGGSVAGTRETGGSHASAQELKQEAAGQARQVGQEAGEQVRQVAETAKQEGRTVVAELKGSVRSQVDTQRDKAAQSLRSLGTEMREMAGDRDDRLAGVMTQVAQRVDDASTWVESHEPTEVLRMVEDFARRRPGLFLASAALAGVVTGRLTRSITAGSPSSNGNGTRGYEATAGTGTSGVYGGYLPGAVVATPEPVAVVTATPAMGEPSVVDPILGEPTTTDPLSGSPFDRPRQGQEIV
jgi:hypothetical protein